MTPAVFRQSPFRRGALAGAAWLVLATSGLAMEWPADYEIGEGTTSPDGHYGILVPGDDLPEVAGENVNFLADLKEHKVLGKIAQSNFRPHRTHQELHVTWAPDSSRCVAEYDMRFGVYSLLVLAPKGEAFQQLDAGVKIRATLGEVISGPSGTEIETADVTCRLGPDARIQFRAIGNDDPKGDHPRSKAAIFQGVFDAASGRWPSLSAQKADRPMAENFLKACAPLSTDFQDLGPESRVVALNKTLADLLRVLKVILPADKFAALETEQSGWILGRDSVIEPEPKAIMILERVKVLRELLW